MLEPRVQIPSTGAGWELDGEVRMERSNLDLEHCRSKDRRLRGPGSGPSGRLRSVLRRLLGRHVQPHRDAVHRGRGADDDRVTASAGREHNFRCVREPLPGRRLSLLAAGQGWPLDGEAGLRLQHVDLGHEWICAWYLRGRGLGSGVWLGEPIRRLRDHNLRPRLGSLHQHRPVRGQWSQLRADGAGRRHSLQRVCQWLREREVPVLASAAWREVDVEAGLRRKLDVEVGHYRPADRDLSGRGLGEELELFPDI